jgi:hypothetical protein
MIHRSILYVLCAEPIHVHKQVYYLKMGKNEHDYSITLLFKCVPSEENKE